jgi:hypothetical protein
LIIAVPVLLPSFFYSQEWTQIGQTLEGVEEHNEFVHSVSISSDGSIIAAGASFVKVYPPACVCLTRAGRSKNKRRDTIDRKLKKFIPV